VVSDPSLAGVRDCQRLVGFVSEINPAGRITVIGNRFDEHEGGEVSKRDMEQAIARPVDLVLPYDRRRVALAATKGVPVASEGGPVATGLTKLVDRIVAAQTPEKKRGLLSRLLAA
jgi:pilus assembly protein CpaE